ncbi:MAG: glycerophosphodiester phosphodiesterase [Actinomycetota bacterium]
MRRWGILAAALCAVSFGAVRVPAAPDILVAAHRGGAAIAPENTLAAFQNAAGLFGAHPATFGWIEMDARLSADGAGVIVHDDTLDRTTDCTGRVADATAAELALCNAAQAWPSWGFQKVPTMRDVFEEARVAPNAWRIMLEIKDIPIDANFDATGRLALEVVGLVGETAFPHQNLIVQSFWPPFLDLVEVLDPQIRTMLLTTSTLPGAPEGIGFTLTQNIAYSTTHGYEICAPDHMTPDLDEETVALAHSLNRSVITWTVNSTADRDRVLAAGVDGIITDDPNLMF